MSLATRCPQCNTLFRVSADQLRHHEGLVTCGQCAHTFSGIDHLTAGDADAWTQLADLPDAAPADTPQTMPSKPVTTRDANSDSNGGATHSDQPVWDTRKKPKAHSAPLPMWARWVALGLVFLAGWQTLWWQQGLWVPKLPAAQTVLQSIAAPFGRQAVFAAHGRVKLTGSELKKGPPLSLNLALENPTGISTRWPRFVTELLDNNQAVVARLETGPRQYRLTQAYSSSPTERAVRPYLLPGQKAEVELRFDTDTFYKQSPEASISGFRIQIVPDGSD